MDGNTLSMMTTANVPLGIIAIGEEAGVTGCFDLSQDENSVLAVSLL